MTMLEVRDINSYYEDAHILHDVSLDVNEGEIVSLIGRNGAGKTTTLRSIMGLTPPRTGSITYGGERIDGLGPEKIYEKGIALVPEQRNIFPDLTVHDNLLVGLDSGQDKDEAFEPVFEYFPRLEERLEQRGGTLSGGEQQMLAIGRVLVSGPELLLIDEPTEGLMPTLVDTIADIIQQLNDEGHTIVMVEQNVDMTLDLSDRSYIIANGRVVASGVASDIQANMDDYTEYLTV